MNVLAGLAVLALLAGLGYYARIHFEWRAEVRRRRRRREAERDFYRELYPSNGDH